MAKTSIEWTEMVFNPIAGCNDVSEGCRNCYARKMAKRLEAMGSKKYAGLTVLQGSHTVWTGKISFDEKALLAPLKRKKPTRYFVNSMSDLFHENVTDEMLGKIFAVMALCPQHTFQALTKRPAKMWAYLTGSDVCSSIVDAMYGINDDCRIPWRWPLPNVWLGVSAENQKAADERLKYLCFAADRGWQTMVSFEPLLGPVDPDPQWLLLGGRTWAIVGGESGHGARPMHPDWARSLRDQCVAASIPYFFKQWGSWGIRKREQHLFSPEDSGALIGCTTVCSSDRASVGEQTYCALPHIPKDLPRVSGDKGWVSFERLANMQKGRAGRKLDGIEWNQMPARSS